ELRRADRLFDLRDQRPLPRLDGDQARISDRQRRHLVEGRRRAVVLDAYAVEDRQIRAAGTHFAELASECLDCFVDVALQALDDVVHHALIPPTLPRLPTLQTIRIYVVRAGGPMRGSRRSSSTSVPSGSPSTTRRMLPGTVMLKTRMGRLLSLHR